MSDPPCWPNTVSKASGCTHWKSAGLNCRKSSSPCAKGSSGLRVYLELCHTQRKCLGTDVPKLNLRLRVLPRAAEPDDDAFAELGVTYALANSECLSPTVTPLVTERGARGAIPPV